MQTESLPLTCGRLLYIIVGVNVNARDCNRKTPLHITADECEENLLKLLLNNKADTGLTDIDGNTPLDIAATKH